MITVVGGSVVLAKVSDRFRKVAENYIPGSTELFKLLIGSSVPQITYTEKPRYTILAICFIICVIYYIFSTFNEGLLKKKLEREAARKDGGKQLN